MRRWLAVGGVLAAFVAAGCGQSPTVKVTGTVTIKGQPAENVQVTFPARGRASGDGRDRRTRQV